MATHQTIPDLAGVAGPVLDGTAPGLGAEVAAFNAAVAHRPAVTVGATCAADVAEAVGWAARRGLPIAVQSTGHGAVVPREGGLLITTRRMRSLTVDPAARTARVEAGVQLFQVLDAAAPHGLAPLVGSAPDVGAVGFATGGGLPIVGRTFGFAADHVTAFEIVTADGRVRSVDALHEPDLFWAVRGGKGNFGVVTAMTIDLLPISTLYAGAIYYAAEAVPDVLRAYASWAPGLPEETTTSVTLLRLPPLPFVPPPLAGKLTIGLRVAHVGDPGEGARHLAHMREVAPALLDTVGELPYARCGEVYQDPPDPLPFWEQATLLRGLPPDAVEQLLAVCGPGVASPLAMVEVRHLDGALSRPPHVPNAVGGRDAAFALIAIGVPTPDVADILPAAGRATLSALRPWSAEGALLNFQGEATSAGEVARAWPPDVYARLRAVKKEVDPANLFRAGHDIPPG